MQSTTYHFLHNYHVGTIHLLNFFLLLTTNFLVLVSARYLHSLGNNEQLTTPASLARGWGDCWCMLGCCLAAHGFLIHEHNYCMDCIFLLPTEGDLFVLFCPI